MKALAVLALAALASAPPPAAPQEGAREVPTIEEPETEVRFPIELAAYTVKELTAAGELERTVHHQLAGTGVRVKKKFFMNFNVYAFGFYLDQEAAMAPLRKAAEELDVDELGESDAFRAAMLGDDFGKTMRLVMVRDVDADTMAEAFEESLWPRMQAATEEGEERDAAEAALARFRGFFEKEAEEDQVMDFSWQPGGKLHATVDGKAFPVVEDLALCRALFDVYLGSDPISADGRENVLRALHAKLHPATAR